MNWLNKRRRLALEQFEERLVPAQVVTFSFQNGLLQVRGDDSSGDIALDVQNGFVRVNGESTGKTDADVSNIQVLGLAGNDVLRLTLPAGFQAACTLDGGTGDDRLAGGDTNDTLLGGDGNDDLSGNGGDDGLVGGNGNDRLDGGDGNNSFTGGRGQDSYAAPTTGSVNALVENFGTFENPTGVAARYVANPIGSDVFSYTFANGDTADEPIRGINRFVLTGTAQADSFDLRQVPELPGLSSLLSGSSGNDALLGTAGPDELFGFLGNDLLSGFGGNDLLVPGAGDDTIAGGSGTDTLRNVATSVTDPNFDGRFSGNVIITLTDGEMRAETFAGVNLHRQLLSNDIEVIDLAALDGAATVDVSNFTKQLRFDGGAGSDRILSTGQIRYELTDRGLERTGSNPQTRFDRITLTSVERAALTGTGGLDVLDASGFTGAAVLRGLGGNDNLIGGAGADVLEGGLGNDLLSGNAGGDTLDGGFGDDRLNGGPGNDSLIGGFGDDTFVGGGGDDLINGGPGNDGIEVRGTAGDDVITVGQRGGGRALVTVNGVAQAFRYVNGETVTAFAGTGNDVVQMADSVGSAWRALFYGEEGDDVLIGGAASDTLDGGAGRDLLWGRGGTDHYVADDGVEDMIFADLADLLDRLDRHDRVIGR